MLTITGLTKTYRGFKTPAVKQVSISVRKGEIYGFLGQNGAGKSTIINCVAGLLKPDCGDILLGDASLYREPLRYKKLLGYVADTTTAFESLSGKDYVFYAARLYGSKKEGLENEIAVWAKRFQLTDAIDKPIRTYSNGMKQKINIIAALIHGPSFWLFDEPMTGLDPRSTYELVDFMRSYAAEGNSVVFSSHLLEIVEKVCDRVGIIHNGQILGEFDLNSLKLENSNLRQLYMSLTACKK